MRFSLRSCLGALLLLVLTRPALPCTLCVANLRRLPTLRLEVGKKYSKLVMYGRVIDSRLDARTLGGGESSFRVDTIFKHDPAVKYLGIEPGKVVTLSRYLPVDNKKDPPHFLLFCDLHKRKLDPYRGIAVASSEAADYLSGAIKLAEADSAKRLLYYFDYLEHSDREIATDAFLEFAKANDSEVGAVASKLSAEKLRGWLKNEETPVERIGLYAFLLGACGSKEDAEYLRSRLDKPDARAQRAYDGFVSGYIRSAPEEGWRFTHRLLGAPEAPLTLRLSTTRALEFYHGWQPLKSKPQVMKGLMLMLADPDLADVAIENLRQWKWWEATPSVLALHGREGYTAPIMKRHIIRFALSAAHPDAESLVKQLRKTERDIVEELEEGLRSLEDE